MNDSDRGRIARFVPQPMRSGRGRDVSVVLAAFATVATVVFIFIRGRRHPAVAS